MAKKNRPWDPAVLIFVVVCLLIGWFVKRSIEDRTVTYKDNELGISITYPATWVILPSNDVSFFLKNTQSESVFHPRVTVLSFEWYGGYAMGDFIEGYESWLNNQYLGYMIITKNSQELRNLKATQIVYAYLFVPFGSNLPTIVRAFDLITIKDNQAYIFTFAADVREYDDQVPIFNKIANSIAYN
jgi:hypothetical protein